MARHDAPVVGALRRDLEKMPRFDVTENVVVGMQGEENDAQHLETREPRWRNRQDVLERLRVDFQAANVGVSVSAEALVGRTIPLEAEDLTFDLGQGFQRCRQRAAAEPRCEWPWRPRHGAR